MEIILIAALGKNYELGKGNQLLWSLPADMQHFRKTTQSATVVMGRKTFESIGRPLPKRRNIVLTRDPSFSAEGVEIFNNPQDILKLQEERIFIIGGTEIYRLFLPHAQTLLLSFVEAEFPDADAFFPSFEKGEWERVSQEDSKKDAENLFSFSVQEFRRRAKAGEKFAP